MSDVFAEYGKRATTTVSPRLVGVLKTRAEARERFGIISAELKAAAAAAEVEACLSRHAPVIKQFQAELEFLWAGDGMFPGLEKEIEWARARVDAGLDFPRWEPANQEEGTVQ